MAKARNSAFGVIATIQAIIVLFFAIFLILHAYCVVNFYGNSFLFTIIKTLYFHDPGLCGKTINIGTLIDGVADQAFIKMEYAPFTYNRTLYFIWGNFGVAIFCLIANELMFRKLTLFPWIMVSLIACLLDLSGILIYLNETHATKTLPDVMTYIGAKSFGAGNLTLDTASVAPVMALIISKCLVFLVINSTLLVWYALDRNDQYNSYRNAIAMAENPVSPAHFAPETIDVSPQHLPRPSLYRNDRFMATLGQRDIEAGCSRASRDLTIALRQPEPTLTRHQRAFSAEDIRIRVPDALLSLPQRLEKIIADESRNLELSNELREINETHEGGKTGGVGQGSILFPECTLTLPRELEQSMKHQTRCLDSLTYTFKVQHKDNNPLSVSFPKLQTDHLLYPSTNEVFEEYKVWWLSDYNPERRLDHMRLGTDSSDLNDTAKAASVSRRNSVDSVLYSINNKQLVFLPSPREDPDVLY